MINKSNLVNQTTLEVDKRTLSEPPSGYSKTRNNRGGKSKFANGNNDGLLGNDMSGIIADEIENQLNPNKNPILRPSSSRSRMSRNSSRFLKKVNNDNKEMDWFAFENRVREIVRDILEPYAIRSVDIQETLRVLSDNHDKFKRKQDEMEFVMHKRNHRNSGIDELNKKLFDIENERKVREARNMQAIESLKVQLEASTDRMTQIEELSLTFKKQADDIKHEISGFFDQLTRFQEKFSKDQLKYKEEMNKNFLTLRNQYLKTEELSKVNKNYINNHFDELKRHDMIVQSYQKNFNELYKKMQQIDKSKIDVSQFSDETIKIKKDINHVRFLNEDVFQSVQLIDSYIEEFIPLKIEKILKSKMDNGTSYISPLYKYKKIFKKAALNEEQDENDSENEGEGESEHEGEMDEEAKKENKKKKADQSKALDHKTMIEKYQKLTESLKDQQKELDDIEEQEMQKIQELIKEEESMELDADKVVDYLINLIAYLNDDNNVDNDGKITRKLMDPKELLKRRFQKAGFTQDLISGNRQSVIDSRSSRRGNYKANSNKITSEIISGTPSNNFRSNDEMGDNMSFTPAKSGFANNIDSKKNPKSLNMQMDSLSNGKLNFKPQPDVNDNFNIDHRKLKIEDLDDETAELIFKALDDVKEIKEKIEQEKSIIEGAVYDMKKEINNEREVLKAKFESNKIYLQKYVENIQKDLEEELIKRNRDKANFNMKINQLDDKVNEIKNNNSEHLNNSENLVQAVNRLNQIAQINYAMELQDEIDREKLALMGYKDETVVNSGKKTTTETKSRNTNAYVSLDKQCLTCSGQSSVVMKAFKIACLAYQPSPVNFPVKSSKTYSRLDLIDLKGNILSLEKPTTKDQPVNSLFHTRQPKVTIRSEAMSSSDMTGPVSPQDIKRKNITMLSEKTEALAHHPLNEAGLKKLKKRDR